MAAADSQGRSLPKVFEHPDHFPPCPEGLKLNIGSGPKVLEGWISIDGSWQARFSGHPLLSRIASKLTGRTIGTWPEGILCCDIRRRLPFADASVAALYASHILEHVYRSEAVAFLREARRVLRPGGICRIVVPDAAGIVSWYLANQGAPDASDKLMTWLCVGPKSPQGGNVLHRLYRNLNNIEFHKWMYDVHGLALIFTEAGFVNPRQCRLHQSSIPGIEMIEYSSRVEDGAGVCMEAVV